MGLHRKEDRRPRQTHGSLVVSPHADDAALSVGAILATGLLPEPVTVVTVFGVSGFSADALHGDIRTVTRVRRAEDRGFASEVNATLVTLDHLDAPLRIPRAGLEDLFTRLPDQALVGKVAHDLAYELAVARADVLVAPAAIGHHVDHLVARAAALSLAVDPTYLYADQPYALARGGPLGHVDDGVRLTAADRGVAALKRALAAGYASQPAAKRLDVALAAAPATVALETMLRVPR